MATEPKRIKVIPNGDLARLLEEAAEGPVVLETNGERYRLDRVEGEREAGIWADYDAEEVRKAIETYAGIWAGRDTDAMIERIYRAREEGSRPADRP